MPFIHVFVQHKLPADTLARLSPEEQTSLERAAVGGRWSRDAGGGLLSSLQVVALPAVSAQSSVESVIFDWPDSATLGLARSAAQPQLLVCDARSAAPRSDLLVHCVGLAAHPDGSPFPMYAPVPRLVAEEVRRQFKGAIGDGQFTALAYRTVGQGEQIWVVETQLVTRKRNGQVMKVQMADVFDLELLPSGTGSEVKVQRRAVLRESGPYAPPVSLLGGSLVRPMLLHALSPGLLTPYAVMEGTLPASPEPGAAHLLLSLTQPKPPPVVQPPEEAKPPKAPKLPKELKAAQPPKSGHPAQTGTPSVLPPIPEVTGPSPSGPSLPAAPPDPWIQIPTQMAVDPMVLTLARATLARHRPLLLTGAPGTGKTLLATLLASATCGDGQYTLVTADARWTSSEVLGGLKVVPGGTLRYAFTPGIVTRAAQAHARSVAAGGPPHALIIDEFNRAHQDEAFGRLLTLLDPAYRRQMPLVGPDDGAPEAVRLPEDFILIATMNDADSARLHDLSAALQRRFTTLNITVPLAERAFLEARYPQITPADFAALYGQVGSGQDGNGEPLRLRGAIAVGTSLMCEVLEYRRDGLSLDAALSLMAGPLLGALTVEDAEQLHQHAQTAGFEAFAERLRQAGTTAAF